MTPQTIIKMIDDFCDEHKTNTVGIVPGYCFEHLVLGDCNLYDSNIDFCLEKERIAEWINDKAKDMECLPGKCDWWRLGIYSIIVDYAHSASSFLCKLKEIPESEREAAMDWYNRDAIELLEQREEQLCQPKT